MQLNDILQQGGGLQSLARELDISESEAGSGAAALLPAILGGFKRQAQAQPTGLEGIGDLLEKFGGPAMLDEVLAPTPTDPRRGNDVLGEIFGSREVSRTVAQHAATQSGLDATMLKKMLPLLVMLVGGFIARQHGSAQAAPDAAGSGPAGLDALLGGLLGGGSGTAAPESPAGGFGSLLDLNGDGNPLDDILRMASSAMR